MICVKEGGYEAVWKAAEREKVNINLILYPYIRKRKISHGRAAEILGIHKLDLIDIYGKMGFCYFDQTKEELESTRPEVSMPAQEMFTYAQGAFKGFLKSVPGEIVAFGFSHRY